MIISHTHKFIFFSNPKTGSHSMRALLREYQEEDVIPFTTHMSEEIFHPHMRPFEAERVFTKNGRIFGEYFKFIFVRNPWERMPSVYEMIKRRDKLFCDSEYKILNTSTCQTYYRGNPGFIRWLATARADGKGGGGSDSEPWRKYGTYSLANFASDACGRRLVDAVIRLENAREELANVFSDIGLPKELSEKLPHLNSYTSQHYSKYYDQNSKNIVEARYKSDIQEFDYKFEPK